MYKFILQKIAKEHKANHVRSVLNDDTEQKKNKVYLEVLNVVNSTF